GDVSLFNKTTFHGVVYAPQSAIYLYNNVYFYGAFVGATVKTDAGARIHYDTALRGQ
ncbi:MAG: hypothetical protein HYZ72_07300, partial [Deltaproteobacteria bacterium]|nr:hypothetical protein [Deltaproteobacteria bacterium]